MNQPPIGIVAGSGIDLTPLFDSIQQEIPFDEIPSIPTTHVQGHSGKFISGFCNGIPVLLQSGRIHFYEGHPLHSVTATIDYLDQQGVRTLLLTNAAGGLQDTMKPGDLMAQTTVQLWEYAGWPEAPNSFAMDFQLTGCDLKGTLTWVHGPCYETRAEIKALQTQMSHAVGMSIAPEVARCKELNIRVGGVSCITNNCCMPHTLTHEEVLETAQQSSERLHQLIRTSLPELVETGRDS
jgi:purine-nucleoside phosphorylase